MLLLDYEPDEIPSELLLLDVQLPNWLEGVEREEKGKCEEEVGGGWISHS